MITMDAELEQRLEKLEALFKRLTEGDYGPEGMSNFDDITLSGGLTLAGALAAASLALTTPLPLAQLATQNANFLVPFYSAGAQTTGVKKSAALIPVAATLVSVTAYLDTAPTTASFIVDANKNGVTVFTTQGNRPTILSAANASSVLAPEVTAFAAGDRFSYDVDQIGSGTAGSDLYVVAMFKKVLVA